MVRARLRSLIESGLVGRKCRSTLIRVNSQASQKSRWLTVIERLARENWNKLKNRLRNLCRRRRRRGNSAAKFHVTGNHSTAVLRARTTKSKLLRCRAIFYTRCSRRQRRSCICIQGGGWLLIDSYYRGMRQTLLLLILLPVLLFVLLFLLPETCRTEQNGEVKIPIVHKVCAPGVSFFLGLIVPRERQRKRKRKRERDFPLIF